MSQSKSKTTHNYTSHKTTSIQDSIYSIANNFLYKREIGIHTRQIWRILPIMLYPKYC